MGKMRGGGAGGHTTIDLEEQTLYEEKKCKNQSKTCFLLFINPTL